MIDTMTIQLNESQAAAVAWQDGPLLVLAGPGSGKTTVLTERIIRILNESPDDRFRILALTFTQNAAHHMRAKIDLAVQIGRERAYLTTFHAFCADIIRQHGEIEDIRTDFSIMTMDLDREELLTEIIRDQISKGQKFAKEDVRLLPKINSFLEQCFVISEPPNPDSDLNKAKALFFHYVERMRQTGRIDFAGILYFAWLILAKPQVQKHYNVVYKYICIDEYQDTNLAQFNVLSRLLKTKKPNLFIVADDDQIVYQWNGASPERLQQIISTYDMETIQLPENYRCPAAVVSIANKMIAHNRNRYAAKRPSISLSSITNDQSVRVRSFDSFKAEIEWIIEDIQKLKRTAKDTRIMGRTRKVLEEAKEIFSEKGIPATLYQRKAEFESPPLRFVHSYLRLLVSRGDKVQLQRLSAAYFQLEGINLDVHEIIGASSLVGGDLLQAWLKQARERPEVSDSTAKLFAALNFDVDLVQYEALTQKLFLWLDSIQNTEVQMSQSAYDSYLSEREIWHNLQEEIRSEAANSLTLSSFLQELDLRDKSEPVPTGAFEMITIHGAKGLEFQHVYLIAMVNDILPAYNSIKSGVRPEALEEERRACYVAITRTQETLTMTYASRYQNWQKSPSKFLTEMGLLK